MNTFAIVGDIHANLTALLSVLKSIDKYREKENINNVLFMGDLLSYGVQTNECIDELIKYSKKNKCIFILGNHDLIYLQENKIFSSYLSTKSYWIQDSITDTLKNLDKNLLSKIKFKNYFKLNSIIFSHANPYVLNNVERYDWSYLNTFRENICAISYLKYFGISLGVFAHTHRRKIFTSNYALSKNKFLSVKLNSLYKVSTSNQITILNAGCIGQPRSKEDQISSWTLLKEKPNSKIIEFSYKTFDVDINLHLKSIEQSDLKKETKEKLKSFFVKK